MQLVKKLKLSGKIVAETGLRVGTGRDVYEIGGIDSSVIKLPDGVPYIPGSSIKGKLRCLFERTRLDLTPLVKYRLVEQEEEKARQDSKSNRESRLEELKNELEKLGWRKIQNVFVHTCKNPDCEICTIFGRPAEFGVATPTRVIVRDAVLDREAFAKKYPDLVKMGLYTEVKSENAIDRLTSAANTRQIERVPKGAEFYFELLYSVYDDKDEERFKRLFFDEDKGEKGELLTLLENDYLGGMGSRGYGQVRFEELKVEVAWERS